MKHKVHADAATLLSRGQVGEVANAGVHFRHGAVNAAAVRGFYINNPRSTEKVRLFLKKKG
jgi:hypothetical protein